MQFSAAALLAAALAGVASAYTQPVGANPEGNPISAPAHGQQVEEGKPFTITWEATTPSTGTVTLLLVHGPSTNVKPLYPIVEKIPNTGSYVWTPKSDLKPEATHYGIQLIVDANGQYQYTPQFGIAKGSKGSSGSSGYVSASEDCSTTPAAETTTCTDDIPAVTPIPETTCTDETTPITTPVAVTYTHTKHHKTEETYAAVTVTVTAPCACEEKTKKHHTPTATPVVPYPAYNATTPCPSSASLVTIPIASATQPIATSPPIHTGAAVKNAVAAGAVVLGAMAVAMGL